MAATRPGYVKHRTAGSIMSHSVFITGATGYIGQRLVPRLTERGHQVKALIRKGSEHKLAGSVERVIADPLQFDSYTREIRPSDTFVHLIGVPHPNPAKAAQFRQVDLVSIRVALKAASESGVRHFIYLSVAQPAPVMKAFLEVRCAGEEMLRASGMTTTFVRPWYVLGPGHYWPYPLVPIYWMLERLPLTRESARRLGLVTVDQMVQTLVWAIENPPDKIRIVDVLKIRELGSRR
jgi:nucleoside-diphosphate-sugar epimerase